MNRPKTVLLNAKKINGNFNRTKLFLAIFTILSMALMGNQQAFAAPIINNNFPTDGSGNYTATGGQFTPVTGVGRGAFNGRTTWAKVYIPIGVNATVTINQVCSLDLNSPSVDYQIRSLSDQESDTNGNFGSPPLQSWTPAPKTSPAGSCPTISFPVSSKNGVPATAKKGHEKYRVFAIVALIGPRAAGDPANAERYFKVNVTGAGSLIGAASSANLGLLVGANDFYSVYKGHDANPDQWNYSVYFAPPCEGDDADHPSSISIFDADNDIYQRAPYMDAYMEKIPRNLSSLSWVNVKNWDRNQVQGGPLGASGTTGTLPLTYNRKDIYRFVIRGSNYPNTVQIKLPFDQIDGDTALLGSGGCSPPQPWKLTNRSIVNPGVGGYSPAPGDSTATLSSKAKAAYQNARFYHSVQNLPPPSSVGTANNGSHNSHIQYRLIRASSANWGNSQNNSIGPNPNDGWVAKSSSQSATLSPGASFPITDGGSSSASIPRSVNSGSFSDDLAYLLKACPSHSGCDTSGVGLRTPTGGDTYCERVWTSPSTDSGGPTITSEPVCVTLPGGAPPPNCSSLGTPCVTVTSCFDWQVIGSSTIQGVSGTTPTTGPLGNSISDAWVGDSYGYFYDFSKQGSASMTSPITFQHNGDPSYSQVLGVSRPKFYSGPIAASMGGQTLGDQVAYNPTHSSGADNCSSAGSNTLSNNIFVPYYYHLKSSSAIINGSHVSQGDPINTTVSVNLPTQDDQGDLSGDAASDNENGGRQHTDSPAVGWRIIEFRTSDINDAKTKIPKNKSGSSGNCAEIGSFGIVGFTGCNDSLPGGSGSQPFIHNTTSTFSYTRPAQLDPVGTIVCYVGVVAQPTENPSPAKRYSDVSCTTVVKSPKVQFLNADLTVGRHRLGDGATATQLCTPLNSGASIQATGAPGAAPPPTNLYGSWVEYSAFAPGNIINFGTAAYAQTSSNDEKKLAFANTPSAGGYNTYGNNCVSNSFDLVNVNDPTAFNDITPYITTHAGNLDLDNYFTTPPNTTSAGDKTGYVSTGNDIAIVNSAPNPLGSLQGRDIIIYARKATPGSVCNESNPAIGGSITVKSNINYATSGYTDISKLPRIILLADCKIIIDDGVKNVDAWLVAKDAVETCSKTTGDRFTANTIDQSVCIDQLKINGPVQANRLLLWRTHGGDLTTPQAAEAAEVFDLRPDQLLATYARGRDAGKPTTVYQTDLPPLY